VATALAQIASAPAFTVPAQSVSGVATQASPAPSPAPLTADPHPTGSDPQTPHRPASSYPPAPSRGPDGAPPFPPGRIGATLRYMKETLSRMDPNTSETGDFSTDFLVAIDRGLRTGNAQGPVAPAA
jgi:hypothetical protein